MAINEALSDAVAQAVDKYQQERDPNLMVGDIIDSLDAIARKLEATLHAQAERGINRPN